MTTALETRVLPKAFAAVKKYGTTATFTLYPDAVADTDESNVELGNPVVHTVRITPPDALAESFSDDGKLVLSSGVKFQLMTGALTSEPIAFVPEPGQVCTVAGKQYRVRKADAVPSGDQVAYYEIEARA